MTSALTSKEIEQHNLLFDRAMELVRGELLIDGQEPVEKEGWEARLQEASSVLSQALAIDPSNWSAHFFMGKIHQRLGEGGRALGHFLSAHKLNPSQLGPAQETVIACIDVGNFVQAIEISHAMLRFKPGNPSLMSNLALAYLLAGELGPAEEWAEEATSRDPQDPITQDVLRVVTAVKAGQRTPPRNIREYMALVDQLEEG